MDQVDEEYLKEIIQGQSTEGKHDVVVADEGLTMKDIMVHFQVLICDIYSRSLTIFRNKPIVILVKETLDEIAN